MNRVLETHSSTVHEHKTVEECDVVEEAYDHVVHVFPYLFPLPNIRCGKKLVQLTAGRLKWLISDGTFQHIGWQWVRVLPVLVMHYNDLTFKYHHHNRVQMISIT